MKYPKKIVDELGGKAGLLEFVKKELPEIPQEESHFFNSQTNIDEIVDLVFSLSQESEVLIRPSVSRFELDDLDGYLPTKQIQTFDSYPHITSNFGHTKKQDFTNSIRDQIEQVHTSPEWRQRQNPVNYDLNSKAHLIVVPMSPSLLSGVYLKHPNREGVYLMGASITKTLWDVVKYVDPWAPNIDTKDPRRSNYYCLDGEVAVQIPIFSRGRIESSIVQGRDFLNILTPEIVEQIPSELKKVTQWHDKIAEILDPKWTYVIEFGLFPKVLWDVKYFKPIERANFRLERKERIADSLSIGTTTSQGITTTIETDANKLYDARQMSLLEGDIAFYGELRQKDFPISCQGHIPTDYAANLMWNADGFLMHNDVQKLRRARVSFIIPKKAEGKYKQGDRLRIICDGYTINLDTIN